jgi:hypothetical protein
MRLQDSIGAHTSATTSDQLLSEKAKETETEAGPWCLVANGPEVLGQKRKPKHGSGCRAFNQGTAIGLQAADLKGLLGAAWGLPGGCQGAA